jgi:hypothetical protein
MKVVGVFVRFRAPLHQGRMMFQLVILDFQNKNPSD